MVMYLCAKCSDLWSFTQHSPSESCKHKFNLLVFKVLDMNRLTIKNIVRVGILLEPDFYIY